MPMKAMIYKTLSTVVDDLFAYVTRHCGRMWSSAHGLVQVLYQDAHTASIGVFPRRCCVPHLPVSGRLVLPPRLLTWAVLNLSGSVGYTGLIPSE